MTNWSNFKNINAKQLNEQAKSLNKGDFEEVPVGKYEVRIEGMELKPTKTTGAPMLAVKFRIVHGDFENRLIFMNQVILMGNEHDAMRVSIANRFLESLGTDVPVDFEGVEEYQALIERIFNTLDQMGLEYLLDFGERNGFKTYKIAEVYDK